MDNEEEVYEAFDHANKFKLGVIAGVKIISDVKANNIEEVKRLIPSSLWAMLTLRY